MPAGKPAEIDKASSAELLALAKRLEHIVTFKRMVDTESGEEGAGLVRLSGRELELVAEAVHHVAAKAWSESR